MKTIKLLILLTVFGACVANEKQPLPPQWFSQLSDDQSKRDLQSIIFSPDDLSKAFANLKEATFEDTTLLNNFIPTHQFELYELPKGPGIIFSLRCAELSGEGMACAPVKNGCKCYKGKDSVDIITNEAPIRYCELVTNAVTGVSICEGKCKDGRECFPLMMYNGRFRQSGGVAGCLCWPIDKLKP
jgi:hypothetical protein